MLARQLHRAFQPVSYDVVGGNAKDIVNNKGNMYKGPEWFTSGANDDIYQGVYRN
jgi:hypothetical protein